MRSGAPLRTVPQGAGPKRLPDAPRAAVSPGREGAVPADVTDFRPQVLSVTEQLDAGVRYLDLRIAHMLDGSANNLHFVHMVYTSALVEVGGAGTGMGGAWAGRGQGWGGVWAGQWAGTGMVWAGTGHGMGGDRDGAGHEFGSMDGVGGMGGVARDGWGMGGGWAMGGGWGMGLLGLPDLSLMGHVSF